jgi:hypothetical protein
VLIGIEGKAVKKLWIGRRKILAREMHKRIHDDDVPKMEIQGEKNTHARIDNQECLGNASEQQEIGQ